MRPRRPFWYSAAAGAAVALTAACADGPVTGPAASAAPGAPSLAKTSTNGNGSHSFIISRKTVGDTTVTVFMVGTDSRFGTSVPIGNSSKIDFPFSAGSICDVQRSSYGPGTWDQRCMASVEPVRITAKSWVNAQGKLATDFQPALRFVPNLRRSVTLYLKDAQLASTTKILYCSGRTCIDEAATDPSLATQLDATNGHAYRVIKHFSGYTVTAD